MHRCTASILVGRILDSLLICCSILCTEQLRASQDRSTQLEHWCSTAPRRRPGRSVVVLSRNNDVDRRGLGTFFAFVVGIFICPCFDGHVMCCGEDKAVRDAYIVRRPTSLASAASIISRRAWAGSTGSDICSFLMCCVSGTCECLFARRRREAAGVARIDGRHDFRDPSVPSCSITNEDSAQPICAQHLGAPRTANALDIQDL